MEIPGLFNAAAIAFAPIGVLTFLITYFSYKGGVITPEDDQQDEWDITSSKSDDFDLDESIDKALDEKKPSNNALHAKWLSFGGGYYGLMALLTFAVIEAKQIFHFVMNFPGWQALRDMLNVQDMVDLLVDQIMNMVDAFVWFIYWQNQIDMQNGWVYLGLSYLGYYLGNRAARLLLKAAS